MTDHQIWFLVSMVGYLDEERRNLIQRDHQPRLISVEIRWQHHHHPRYHYHYQSSFIINCIKLFNINITKPLREMGVYTLEIYSRPPFIFVLDGNSILLYLEEIDNVYIIIVHILLVFSLHKSEYFAKTSRIVRDKCQILGKC